MGDDDWWAEAAEQFGLDDTAAATEATEATETTDAAEAGSPPSMRRRRHGIEWIVVGIVAIGAALLLRAFVVQQFTVDGESMLGALHPGDRVLVNKLSYHLHDPRHGDIVVLEDITGSVEVRDLIKRVIGLPGDTVEYRSCKLFIDSRPVTEPYLDPAVVVDGHCGDPQPPLVVEPGHVFVMGDNRASSLDSRTPAIGQVPFEHLIGRAFVIVWPFSDLGFI